MPNRQNKKGRSKVERWFQVQHYVMRSPAFRSLSAQARAIFFDLMLLYNGSNNGRIGLSCRQASEQCNIAKDTAMRAFNELIEKGFIECTKEGAWGSRSKLSPEWRLTHLKCDLTGRLAPKTFMRWGRNHLSQNTAASVPKYGHKALAKAPKQPLVSPV